MTALAARLYASRRGSTGPCLTFTQLHDAAECGGEAHIPSARDADEVGIQATLCDCLRSRAFEIAIASVLGQLHNVTMTSEPPCFSEVRGDMMLFEDHFEAPTLDRSKWLPA